jgi:hypothetical protein
MAQVKLQFRTASGEQMVVARSLMLSVQKGGRKMKTLEGSLSVKSHGQRTAISTRVAGQYPIFTNISSRHFSNLGLDYRC